MTQDDVLFGYRLQLFDLAARTTVAMRVGRSGCTARPITAGSARSIVTGWRCLRPRERRRPAMPNPLPHVIEERIVASRSGTLGSVRAGSRRACPPRVGRADGLSPTASGRCCAATALTRAKRLALVAGYRAPYEPPRETAARAAHRHRPARRAGRHRLLLRRAPARHHGRRLAAHRDRHLRSYAWAELVRCPDAGPAQTMRFAAPRRPRPTPRRLAARARALRQRQRVPRAALHRADRHARRPPHPHPRRPPTDQRPRRTAAPHDPRRVLAARLRALPTARYRGLQRELDATSHFYNHHRAHTGRITRPHPGRPRLRCPQDGAPMSRTCRHISESVQPRPPPPPPPPGPGVRRRR